MESLEFSPDAIADAGTRVRAAGTDLQACASTLSPPDPGMYGIMLSTPASLAEPDATRGNIALLQALSGASCAAGDRLTYNARSYRDLEERQIELIQTGIVL